MSEISHNLHNLRNVVAPIYMSMELLRVKLKRIDMAQEKRAEFEKILQVQEAAIEELKAQIVLLAKVA